METNQIPNPPQINVPMPPSPLNSGSQGAPQGFMGTLEYYLVTKAPFQIPANVKEIIVKFGPWLIVIALLGFVPLILALSGFRTISFFYSSYYSMYGGKLYLLIFPAINFVLEIIALPGLFGRKMFGWNMIFYAVMVSFAGSVISGNIVGGIIFAIIGLYVLFQIRSYYN